MQQQLTRGAWAPLACALMLILGGCGGGGGGGGVRTYTIGGSIGGLFATGLTLADNGGDTLAVPVGATTFTFATPVGSGNQYNVTVASQPVGNYCTVSSGFGTVTGDVTTVAITCVATYTVGGTLSGLASGAQVTLLDNGADPLTLSSNGSFYFSALVPRGGSYNVTVSAQPAPQSCNVASGSGTVSGAVTDVAIVCELKQRVLYAFTGGSDGGTPSAGVIMDSSGDLYGTTTIGGSSSHGTVFELSPGSSGYTESILHAFSTGSYGANVPAGLIIDSAGDLYGTTWSGGSAGDGTVFKLSPDGGGGYTESVLHTFTGGSDGAYPDAGLIMDGAHNLYGTTWGGGSAGDGVVFELSAGSGGYTYSLLHTFTEGNDGGNPGAALVMDGAGNLYGTTEVGGSASAGIVFELTPGAGGYAESVLHVFTGSDGADPQAGLVMDGAGNLYGTTELGGSRDDGIVFELKAGSGGYAETVLYSFTGGADGANPAAGLIMDHGGNLYGTTPGVGYFGGGTVFELTPGSSGDALSVLYSFTGGADGGSPHAALLMDGAGNLYGTAQSGGNGYGAVFEILLK
jgi:uncharacterized repeat protein (TIGR03803 family)